MFERQILVTMLTWMWRQACSMLSSSTRRNPLWVVAQRSIVKATSQLSVRLLCGVSLALARIARFSLIRGDRLNPSHWTTSASTPLRRLSVRLVPVPWGVTEWADHGRIVDPAVKWNSQSGHCFGRKKSRTFQVLSSTYSQTHSHDILPHVTLNVCGSVRNNFSHRGHDDLEQVKFKDFQDPMTASSKFQDPVRFSRTFKNLRSACASGVTEWPSGPGGPRTDSRTDIRGPATALIPPCTARTPASQRSSCHQWKFQ